MALKHEAAPLLPSKARRRCLQRALPVPNSMQAATQAQACPPPCPAHQRRPQPFSQRHNSFLQHYISTGEARILNQQRHVVALNKVGAPSMPGPSCQRMCGEGMPAACVRSCAPCVYAGALQPAIYL